MSTPQPATTPEQLIARKKALRKLAALPEGLRNSVPFGARSTVGRWVFDWLMPKLGIGKVAVRVLDASAGLYRIDLSLPFRTHGIVVNAFTAFQLYNLMRDLAFAYGRADFELGEVMGTGDIYLPAWSLRDVHDALVKIAKDHEPSVRFSLDEMRTLEASFLGTPDDKAEHQSEQEAQQKHTLH